MARGSSWSTAAPSAVVVTVVANERGTTEVLEGVGGASPSCTCFSVPTPVARGSAFSPVALRRVTREGDALGEMAFSRAARPDRAFLGEVDGLLPPVAERVEATVVARGAAMSGREGVVVSIESAPMAGRSDPAVVLGTAGSDGALAADFLNPALISSSVLGVVKPKPPILVLDLTKFAFCQVGSGAGSFRAKST